MIWQIDQMNSIKSPEINSSIYNQLIFDKGDKDTQWKENNLFNEWCYEIIGYSHIKKNETRFIPYAAY